MLKVAVPCTQLHLCMALVWNWAFREWIFYQCSGFNLVIYAIILQKYGYEQQYYEGLSPNAHVLLQLGHRKSTEAYFGSSILGHHLCMHSIRDLIIALIQGCQLGFFEIYTHCTATQ